MSRLSAQGSEPGIGECMPLLEEDEFICVIIDESSIHAYYPTIG